MTASICVSPPKAPQNIRLSPVLLCDTAVNRASPGRAGWSWRGCCPRSFSAQISQPTWRQTWVHPSDNFLNEVCVQPSEIRHLCSTASLVCVPNTLSCLPNSPSSAPSCWWWSLFIMEPENIIHSLPSLQPGHGPESQLRPVERRVCMQRPCWENQAGEKNLLPCLWCEGGPWACGCHVVTPECGGLGGSKDKCQPYEASEKTLRLQNFVWDNNGEQGDQTSQS